MRHAADHFEAQPLIRMNDPAPDAPETGLQQLVAQHDHIAPLLAVQVIEPASLFEGQ